MVTSKVSEIHCVKERDIEKWIMPQFFWNSVTKHWKLWEQKINKTKFPFKSNFPHGDLAYKNILNRNKYENNSYNIDANSIYFKKMIKKINM
jgi:hypothetical protein